MNEKNMNENIEFSEAAQGLARALLKRSHATPEVVVTSLNHFAAFDDITGACLVLEAWRRLPGFNLTQVCRFAHTSRRDSVDATTLVWLRDSVLDLADRAKRYTEAANAWLDSAGSEPEA